MQTLNRIFTLLCLILAFAGIAPAQISAKQAAATFAPLAPYPTLARQTIGSRVPVPKGTMTLASVGTDTYVSRYRTTAKESGFGVYLLYQNHATALGQSQYGVEQSTTANGLSIGTGAIQCAIDVRGTGSAATTGSRVQGVVHDAGAADGSVLVLAPGAQGYMYVPIAYTAGQDLMVTTVYTATPGSYVPGCFLLTSGVAQIDGGGYEGRNAVSLLPAYASGTTYAVGDGFYNADGSRYLVTSVPPVGTSAPNATYYKALAISDLATTTFNFGSLTNVSSFLNTNTVNVPGNGNGNYAYGPTQILGDVASSMPRLAPLGDSIVTTLTAVNPATSVNPDSFSPFFYALRNANVYVNNMSHPGQGILDDTGGGDSRVNKRRMAAIRAGRYDYVLSNHFYNDQNFSAQQVANAHVQLAKAVYTQTGALYVPCTSVPSTTSTNGFATLAGQTLNATLYPKHCLVNDWMRLGCPVLADGATAALPSYSGGATAYTTTAVPNASGTGSMVGYAGFAIDFADYTESSRNSGLWAVPTTYSATFTVASPTASSFTDATHNWTTEVYTVSYQTAAGLQTYTQGDLGTGSNLHKSGTSFVIDGTGNYFAGNQLYQALSTGEVDGSWSAGTPAAGATGKVYEGLVADTAGVHPGDIGIILMSRAINPARFVRVPRAVSMLSGAAAANNYAFAH